jgi:hypothetical protein
MTQFDSKLLNDDSQRITQSENDVVEGDEQNRDQNEMLAESTVPETDYLVKNDDNMDQSDLTPGSQVMDDTEYLKKDDRKVSTPYWTEVLVNKQMKKVLVNVKTVTIIESISPEKGSSQPSSIAASLEKAGASKKAVLPTKSSNTVSKLAVPTGKPVNQSVPLASTKSAAGQSPFIKIQMPSSSSAKSITASSSIPSSGSKYGKKPSSVPQDPSQKYAGEVKQKYAGKTKIKKGSPSGASISSKSPVVNVSSKPALQSASKSTQATASITKQANPSTKKETPTTFGDIFNSIKNMPGAEIAGSRDLYIEGKFTFPKEKVLSKKVFKMNGYISND